MFVQIGKIFATMFALMLALLNLLVLPLHMLAPTGRFRERSNTNAAVELLGDSVDALNMDLEIRLLGKRFATMTTLKIFDTVVHMLDVLVHVPLRCKRLVTNRTLELRWQVRHLVLLQERHPGKKFVTSLTLKRPGFVNPRYMIVQHPLLRERSVTNMTLEPLDLLMDCCDVLLQIPFGGERPFTILTHELFGVVVLQPDVVVQLRLRHAPLATKGALERAVVFVHAGHVGPDVALLGETLVTKGAFEVADALVIGLDVDLEVAFGFKALLALGALELDFGAVG